MKSEVLGFFPHFFLFILLIWGKIGTAFIFFHIRSPTGFYSLALSHKVLNKLSLCKSLPWCLCLVVRFVRTCNTHNLKEERFNLGYGFRGLSPLSAGSMTETLKVTQSYSVNRGKQQSRWSAPKRRQPGITIGPEAKTILGGPSAAP